VFLASWWNSGHGASASGELPLMAYSRPSSDPAYTVPSAAIAGSVLKQSLVPIRQRHLRVPFETAYRYAF